MGYRKHASSIPARKPGGYGFTLVELMGTIAIVAALIAVAMFFVGGYVSWAKQTSDQQTLTVLNDALSRYKGEGGDVTALTAGAPVGDVISALQTSVNWAGTNHQFLKTGVTYPARSLSVIGAGQQYVFTGYNSYTGLPGGVTNPNLNSSAGGLVGWWKLNEGSGSTATDSSGNGNNGTIGSGITWVSGYQGHQALNFPTGFNSRVALSSSSIASFSNTPFSVSVWINIPSYTTEAGFVGTSQYLGGGYSMGEANDGSGKAAFFTDTSSQQYYMTDTSPLPLNTWTNMIGTFDGTTLRLYRNGSLVASAAGQVSANTNALRIGKCPQGGWDGAFTGTLCDVRIYSRALSASEVAQLANSY